MDGVIDIVLVVVMIAGFVWKAMKSGVEEPGENFPPIPIPFQEEKEAVELQKEGDTIRVPKIRQIVTTTKAAAKETVPLPAQPVQKQKPSTTHKLRSPQEARKAFIYSEIFKRKYN